MQLPNGPWTHQPWHNTWHSHWFSTDLATTYVSTPSCKHFPKCSIFCDTSGLHIHHTTPRWYYDNLDSYTGYIVYSIQKTRMMCSCSRAHQQHWFRWTGRMLSSPWLMDGWQPWSKPSTAMWFQLAIHLNTLACQVRKYFPNLTETGGSSLLARRSASFSLVFFQKVLISIWVQRVFKHPYCDPVCRTATIPKNTVAKSRHLRTCVQTRWS